MIGYVGRRLVAAVPVLLLASLVVFAAMRLLPGDPVDALSPADAAVSPAARELLRRELGLDEPLPVQYLRWLGRAVRGDLGTSVRNRRSVSTLVVDRAAATGKLVVLSTLLGLAVAVPLGVLAAARRGGAVDRGAAALALLGLSVPSFALGTLLALVCGVWLRWTPTVGHLASPAVTLAVGTAGFLVRNVRAGVLDQLAQDYLRTARGKGLAGRVIYVRHLLPNALPLTISVLATVIGYQLGGANVVEQVFAWPELGLLMFESVTGRDYAVVQGIALYAAVAYVTVNLVADIARAALDPRLR